ncbi:FAD:protein FMN transferase [Deinococcus xinjiangensis]|uniref:FAD:protein FMN transferase n=1 Tax=Deinococcus xinjiangensis TaxID=457454 RepID=A0ABP9V8G0_9DEIO
MLSVLSRLLTQLRRPYRLHSVYERLLGTEIELQIVAESRPRAERAEQAALAELERLTAILNRFDPQSELRRWLARPHEQVRLSPELREVLRLADYWREVSGGAFHVGADAFGALWQAAAQQRQAPEAERLEQLISALQDPPWTWQKDGTLTLKATYPLGLNALAKGYIVDAMAEAAKSEDGVRAVLVNAGGDLRTIGGEGLTVQVADPRTAQDNAAPLARVLVRNGALASSGGAHRGYQVGHNWYSHVIDPRTGQPVGRVTGVTVTAPDCVTADALATALSVLDIPAGLELTEATPDAAALLLDHEGKKYTTSRWVGH